MAEEKKPVEKPVEESLKKPAEDVILFRHKVIKNFSVGQFMFRDHICAVKKSEEEEFMKAFDGLLGKDQHNIVRVQSLPQEAPVKQAVRGPMTSDSPQAKAVDRK